jgi:DNA (cytosine-5)-methyltransferase 1
LEPSVGSGNFLPLLFKFYEDKEIEITCCDIDPHAIRALKAILRHVQKPESLKINFITGDFLQTNFKEHFDLVIGNPPFSKSISSPLLKQYRATANNHVAKNTAAFFLEKSITLGRQVALIMPKSLLNTPEYAPTRGALEKIKIDSILDFGERGFGDVLIETISIALNSQKKPSKVTIVSSQLQVEIVSEQKYICDPQYPYWLIYRNSNFDKVAEKLKFDVFQVFRDRQITTKVLNEVGDIRVIKSRNIMDDGSGILDIQGYDSYISSSVARKLSVYKFLDQVGLYLTPNMTYKPRVISKPAGILVNGSVAILTLKPGERPFTKKQLSFFSTDEFRVFYRVARNLQTRSLNVDAASVFFFGRLLTDKRTHEVA